MKWRMGVGQGPGPQGCPLCWKDKCEDPSCVLIISLSGSINWWVIFGISDLNIFDNFTGGLADFHFSI